MSCPSVGTYRQHYHLFLYAGQSRALQMKWFYLTMMEHLSVSQKIKVSFHQIDFQNASSMFAQLKPMWVYLNKPNIFHIHPCKVILTLFLSGRPLTGSWRYQVSVWSMSWTNRALFKKALHLNYGPDLTVNEQSYNNSKGSFPFVHASLISILC